MATAVSKIKTDEAVPFQKQCKAKWQIVLDVTAVGTLILGLLIGSVLASVFKCAYLFYMLLQSCTMFKVLYLRPCKFYFFATYESCLISLCEPILMCSYYVYKFGFMQLFVFVCITNCHVTCHIFFLQKVSWKL